MRKILRVDMNSLKCTLADILNEYNGIGGRGLTSMLIASEVNTTCHPLGKNNKLVIAPGTLAGTKSPCSQRTSVGAKSPLTYGIKEANSGGIIGKKLARIGIGAIVLENKPKREHLYILHVAKNKIQLEEANHLKGYGNYDLNATLKGEYGKHVGIISIGNAGEMLMSAATVAMTDKDGIPARHAARGGLGAVMGSKGIKAIIIDDTGTPKQIFPANRESFNEAVKGFSTDILKRPRVKYRLPIYGTAGLIPFANEVNSLPTRNFSTGQFEGMEQISGDTLVRIIDARGGKRGHACYPGCIIRCSNVIMDKEGNHLTSSLEYETLGMLGSNCGIDDIDIIATLDHFCDDYGIDTIEFGGAMGVAMEAGVLSFGDGAGVLGILHEIGKGSPLGRILGNGVEITGKVFGMSRVPVIKGQGLPAWDPRTALATGLTFITSPQGADHTAGRLQGVMEFDHLVPGTIANLSRDMQIRACAYDTLGLCHFADGTDKSIEWLSKLLGAFLGDELTTDAILIMGKKIFETEKNFNLAAGISKVEDRLPEFMLKESLPPTNSSFTVSDGEIEKAFSSIKGF